MGSVNSQFWANVYMNPFDHFVKRELRCRAYLRYVDDYLLFAEDKATLWAWKAAIRRRLARLRLTNHAGDIAYQAIEASAEGWVGHARYGNTVGLRKAVLVSLLTEDILPPS